MSQIGGVAASAQSQTAFSFITQATDNTNSVLFEIIVTNVITNAFLDITIAGAYSDGDGLDVKKYTAAISRVPGSAPVCTIATAAVTGNNASVGHTSMTLTMGSAVVSGAVAGVEKISIRAKVAAGSSAVTGGVHFLFGKAELIVATGFATISGLNVP